MAKINENEGMREYLHRMINEAFDEVIEDVDVKVTDEVGFYKEYATGGDILSEFMTAYPYRSLSITINFFDKTIDLKKVE